MVKGKWIFTTNTTFTTIGNYVNLINKIIILQKIVRNIEMGDDLL